MMPTEPTTTEPTTTDSLMAKMKAIEERVKQRRVQESPPFPPEAPETATPQPTPPEV